MRTGIRLLALAFSLGTVVFWFFGGMNTGWTRNTITTQSLDPVTGISFPVTEKRFQAGVDFLGAGIGFGAALLAVSFLFGKKSKQQSP